jgi:predicted secreted acid phosphatase
MNAAHRYRRGFAVAALTGALALGVASPAGAAPARPAAASATTVGYDQWMADVSTALAPAQSYLAQRVASAAPGAKLAIVLDLDNTALESYFHPTTYPTPATPQVLALARYASAHGVSVFAVTARPDIIDEVTEYNLDAVGYRVAGIYSRNPLQLFESYQAFKTGARKEITNDGYDIVANIGNNTSDLAGGYADTTYKLPDYDGLLS